jgi:hypothetical protein
LNVFSTTPYTNLTYFDVVQYLKDNLSEDQFNHLMEARPKPKVASLLELIEQAKSRNT